MLASCGPHPEGQLAVIGVVQSETGGAVANATVRLGNTNVTTDARGNYKVPYSGKATDIVAVRFEATGYAEASRRIDLSKTTNLPVKLRPVDSVTTITLPSGDQNVLLHVSRAGSAADLTFYADALVNPAGNVVSGAATVSLTYWSPAESAVNAPGLLRAAYPDGSPGDDKPRNLLSYGMVDIDVRQNGEKLQVASGKSLKLVITTTQERRDALASTQTLLRGPTLWTLNPNSGLWEEDTGDSTFDVTTGEMVATLHHLSSKNADEPFEGDVGTSGCMRGRILGACGQPVANVTAVFDLDLGSATSPPGNVNASGVSGSDGVYKFNVGVSGHDSYFASASYTDAAGFVHKTDTNQSQLPAGMLRTTGSSSAIQPNAGRVPGVVITCSDASGQCPNPTCQCYNDVADSTCLANLQKTNPDITDRNPCWTSPLGTNVLGACYDDLLTGGTTDWKMNLVYNNGWTPGTLCQNCWPAVDLVFKDLPGDQTPGCTGPNCCPALAPPGSYTVCQDATSPYRKNAGDPCGPQDTCCGPQPLVCLDKLCVPISDPTPAR